jgi:DNA-binding transcriptional LysR family regulator
MTCSISWSDAVDVRGLRLFVAVAETASVTRAAERLNCVQSNVTARLRRLEEELDVPLFSRTGRGMVLTPAGRVLDDYARRLLALVDEAKRAVGTVRDGAGPLVLGSMETTAAVRLPSVLARFHAAHPAVEISLTTGDSEGLVESVLARRLDAALIGGLIEHPDLESRVVYVEELVLVHDGSTPPKPVLLAFRKGCSYRALAERWLRESGRLPVRVMEFGTLDGILGCVAAGMGCAVLPRAVVERPHYAGSMHIQSLPAALAMVPTRLVWRADAPANPALDAFAGMLDRAAVFQD